ncbi:hypothetical protein C0995_009811 [Termitomyces sp. Mi166|nr:hypothetical protein C0995_009811 [Termitomyces sp. Mi166\
MGIQTFYDDLVSHAQNMVMYLDEFTIQETFLDGIPAEMHRALIRDNNLSSKVNTVTEFLAAGQPGPKKAWDGLPRVSPPKVAFSGGNVGYKPSGGVS